MKKTNNIFDCLENAEGNDMERITKNTPQLDDKQLERILDMSERKYNIKKRNEINTNSVYNDGYQPEAEGVETYNRPVWFRYAATAAALVLTCGIVAASLKLLKNRSEVPNIPSIPNNAATSVITGTTTTDAANADITSVTEDFTTIVSSIETTASTDVSDSAAQASQSAAAPAGTVAPTQPATTQAAAASNSSLTEDQCYDIINQKNDDTIIYEEIFQVPCKEYMDYSDTFFATGVVTHDTFSDGHPLLEKPNEFAIKFVHYTDPRFNTVDDIRNFVKNYDDRWNGGRSVDLDILFGQSIEPGSVIENDLFITTKLYVYTEYNGKIYRGTDPDMTYDRLQTHVDFYTSEMMPLRLGHDYIRNITDSSFEDYAVTENGNGGYYGHYYYYYNDGSQWRMDASKERDLSDAECRQINPF